MEPTLLVLAAGMGSRYGGLKQMDAMGPHGETVMDYAVFDAIRSGFGKVVFVIRKDFEDAFREGVGRRFAGNIEVDYAFQSLDGLPAGFSLPSGRNKPWGTGHAILMASKVVAEPFAVINADDFYGRQSYEKMARFLVNGQSDAQPSPFCMVGYPLKNTLSDFGSVSRGVCDLSSEGVLRSVTELTRIERSADGIRHVEADGSEIVLSGEELVSMNMWGFTPAVFDYLESLFVEFLEERGTEMKSEFYIPFAVDDMVSNQLAKVQVLRSSAAWFGVTYREDREHVISAIATLIENGDYPSRLFN
ncbi:MAG: nucleotidyltransferase [Verrucomicrobiaceae bacterium]|nr:nucleotidyltransferase [Verrucomicrobiaceae bacterium]